MGARTSWQWGTAIVLLLTIATLIALEMGKHAMACVLVAGLGLVATALPFLVLGQQRDASRAAEKALQDKLEQANAGVATVRAMTQAAFDGYPTAAALVWDGQIEFSNARAAESGLVAGSAATDLPAWVKSLTTGATHEGDGKPQAIRMVLNGAEHYFAPRTTIVRDAGGATRGMLIMLTDVTQTKTAGETGAKFVSSFSHELRTPLTSIQMTIHLLLEDTSRMSPRQVEFLQAARDDAHRLQTLIEEMVAAVRARL